MHHFARRTTGYTLAVAASALLLVAGCSDDDDKDSNTAASVTGAVTSVMQHGQEQMSEAAEETKIATQGGAEVAVSGDILKKYTEAGGPAGPLGAPLEALENGPDGGKYQDFAGGTIYWGKDTGTHVVWGEIRKAWEENGGASGKLGYPTSDEKDVAGGKESTFSSGTISWVDGQITVTDK